MVPSSDPTWVSQVEQHPVFGLEHLEQSALRLLGGRSLALERLRRIADVGQAIVKRERAVPAPVNEFAIGIGIPGIPSRPLLLGRSCFKAKCSATARAVRTPHRVVPCGSPRR